MQRPNLVVPGVTDKLVAMVALVELRALAQVVGEMLDKPTKQTESEVLDALGSAKSLLYSEKAKQLQDDWKAMVGG